MIKVKIKNVSKHPLPEQLKQNDAGFDLRANIDTSVCLKPLERTIIPTGLSIELEKGYEAQVRARSGLAAKFGISLVNGIGTIDANYRGDIGVILINLSNKDFIIEDGMRIAQLVINEIPTILWEEVDTLSDTDRGAGGFGHTGIK